MPFSLQYSLPRFIARLTLDAKYFLKFANLSVNALRHQCPLNPWPKATP